MKKLKTSLQAIGMGLFAELIIKIFLWQSIFLLFGAHFGITPLVTASGPCLLSNFAGGFTAALYAKRFKWLHSLAIFFLSTGLKLFGMLVLLRVDKDLLSLTTVPHNALRSMGGFMHYILISGAEMEIFITISVYLLGASLVYFIITYTRFRIGNSYKALNLILQVWGGGISLVGLMLYVMPLYFAFMYGIYPLLTPSSLIPFCLLIISGGLYWMFREVSVPLGTIIPFCLIIHVTQSELWLFWDALSLYGPPIPLSFLIIIAMLGGSYIWRYGQRIFSLGGIGDTKPEIIVLRSFEDDKKSMYSFMGKLWKWLTLRDHFLIMELAKLCRKSKKSVSIVSNPLKDLPSWSVSMIHLDENWIETVTEIIKNSKLIVMIASASKGLLQELKVVANTEKFESLIAVVPNSISAQELNAFENVLRQNGADFLSDCPDHMALAITDSDCCFNYVEFYDNSVFLTVMNDKLYKDDNLAPE